MYRSLEHVLLVLVAAAGLLLAAPHPAHAQTAPAGVSRAGELPDSARFVASSRGTVYYPRACDRWRSLSPRNLIGFATEEAARAAGYVRTRSRACTPRRMAQRTGGGGEGAPRLDHPLACTVSAVVDGDTIDCADGRRIRLLLIDTPEMSQGPYGAEARAALLAMLPVGAAARLEMDIDRHDRWGRTLAYVYDPAGRMVNEEMARLGFALRLTYPPNVRHVERIDAAVTEARSARRGLWSGSAFLCTPRDHRAGRCQE